MPRPKRKVWYEVTTFDDWWWNISKNKWVKELSGDEGSTHSPAKTFKGAQSIANDLCDNGGTALIIRWWRHRGKRYAQEFTMRP